MDFITMLKLLLACKIFSFSILCIGGSLRLIPTQKYLDVASSESFQLKCIGPSRKEWNYPRKQVLSTSMKVFNLNQLAEISNVIITLSADAPDESILTVHNASYSDTGAYQCLAQNKTDSAQIYVFVEDKVHLLADATNNKNHYANEFSNVTIPCKPTARDVAISLHRYDKLMRRYEEFKVGAEASFIRAPLEYHIEEGYILPFVTPDVGGYFQCIGKRGDKEEEIEFNVKFVRYAESLNMPYIAPNKKFVVVGDNVELDCILLESASISILNPTWDFPEEVKDYEQQNNIIPEKIENETSVTKRYHNKLILKKIGMNHQGDYTCTVRDRFHNINKAMYRLKVHPKNATFVNLISDDGPVKIVAPSTNEQRITVRIDANPSVVEVNWNFTNGKQNAFQVPDKKYEIERIDENYVTLIIKWPGLSDSGIYRFSASNGKDRSHIDIKLFVEAIPEIIESLNPLCDKWLLNSGLYLFKYDTEHEISCLSIGYPKPTVSWYFQEFSTFPNFSTDGRLKIHSSNYKNVISNSTFDITTDSRLQGRSLESGMLYCKSCNIFGCREKSMSFLVADRDVEKGFNTWGSRSVISGDNATIHCGASIFEYGPVLSWSYNVINSSHSEQIHLYFNDSNILIINTKTELSYLSTMVIQNMTTNMAGLYTCEAETIRKKKGKSVIRIRVKPSSFPVFLNGTNLNNGTKHVKKEASFELFCNVTGSPKPRIIWYYNNEEITVLLDSKSINNGRISLLDGNGNSTLKFLHATEKETGNYSCKAINRLGSVVTHSTLIVAEAEVNMIWPCIIFFTIFIIVILSVTIIILFRRVKHERALLKELTKTVLETFDDGAEGDLNPELGIVEQADLLPYKKQYEFLRENLKLGKQLGSGAFGVVLKAEAKGIVKDNEVATVAVKMLKQNVDVSHIKALTTELKVMIHLGKHLNVVNLLGACTRNLNNRELLVIVEYCKYGNLHDYLRRNRNNFINQINPKTGLFDSNLIGTRINETERKRLFPSQSTSSYTGATLSDSSVTYYSNCTVMTDFYSNQQDPNSRLVHNYKNLAVDPMDEEDDYIVSNDLLPALKPQSKGEHEFCTEDLLCWSFQTARGMEYLASRKVLHGDLAARNILLAENNVIKICDFGMSKNMNYDVNYCKKGKQLLPVKWLSIEAMRDREFSVYSDIWSFGVVLWEFFSLARTPYPGVEGVEELYKKLESGYRMERPVFAPDIVYRIMLECWNEEPKRRPSFTDLAERLGYMIDRDVQKHFLDLSERLLKFNDEVFDENACLIQPSNAEYQNLIERDHESSITTKDNKGVDRFELEYQPMTKGVNSQKGCGFSNETYGNVDFDQNTFPLIPKITSL